MFDLSFPSLLGANTNNVLSSGREKFFEPSSSLSSSASSSSPSTPTSPPKVWKYSSSSTSVRSSARTKVKDSPFSSSVGNLLRAEMSTVWSLSLWYSQRFQAPYVVGVQGKTHTPPQETIFLGRSSLNTKISPFSTSSLKEAATIPFLSFPWLPCTWVNQFSSFTRLDH